MRTVLHLVWTPWGRCPKQGHREGAFSFIITITCHAFRNKEGHRYDHALTDPRKRAMESSLWISDRSVPGVDSWFYHSTRGFMLQQCRTVQQQQLEVRRNPSHHGCLVRSKRCQNNHHYWKTDGVPNMRQGFPVAGKIKRSLHAQQTHSLVYTLGQNDLRDEAVTNTGRYVNAKEGQEPATFNETSTDSHCSSKNPEYDHYFQTTCDARTKKTFNRQDGGPCREHLNIL